MRPDLLCIANLVKEDSQVLEIGCGEGELLHYLSSKKNIDTRGIEISQAGVSQCMKLGLAVVQGDVETDLVHYSNKSFDYVISSQVLQATYNPKEVLKEMLRIGKYVIISIPNFGHWRNRLYLTIKGEMPVTSSLSYQWYETPNIHFCTIKDFENLCVELKITICKKLFIDETGKKLNKIWQLTMPNLVADKAIYLIKN